MRRFHHFQEAREEFKGCPNDIRMWPVAGQNNAASPLAHLHWCSGYCTAATATAAPRSRWRCIWWGAHTSAGHELCSPNPFLPLNAEFRIVPAAIWAPGGLHVSASRAHFPFSPAPRIEVHLRKLKMKRKKDSNTCKNYNIGTTT